MADRIINRCIQLSLFDEKGRITEEGKNALEINKVFLKENGAYNFWVTKDPLIKQILLDIQEIAVKNIERLKKSEELNSQKLIEIPTWIKKLENKIITLLNKKSETIKIYEYKKYVKQIDNDLNVNVHYYIFSPQNENEIQLNITGDLEKQISELPPYTFEQIWLALLGDQKKRWDNVNEAFLCYFNELNEKEKLNFVIHKSFLKPNILDLGVFDNIIVNDIPIRPINQEEANKWANWILEQKITDYLSGNEYDELCEEIKMMNQFQDYQINFLDQKDFAKKFLNKKENGEIEFLEKYWFLQTPFDLDPTEMREV